MDAYDVEKELLKWEEKRKFCKETYSDWEDNEFNCADLKFILGVKSKEDKSNDVPSYCTLNIFTVNYDRSTKKYFADFDIPYSIRNKKDFIVCLNDILVTFKDYLIAAGEDLTKDYLTNIIYENNLNILNLESDSLTELYKKVEIVCKGVLFSIVESNHFAD